MSTLPPPGWYDDPDRAGGVRFWDGAQWTEHRHDAPPRAATPGAAPAPATDELASWGHRAGALAIDAVMVMAVCFVFMLIAVAIDPNHPDWTSDSDRLPPAAWVAFGATVVVAFVYPWLWMGLDEGRTIGRRALGIRVVDMNGAPVGLGRAGLRELACKGVLAIVAPPLLLSYLWPLWEPENRALHDLMAGTRVVRA